MTELKSINFGKALLVKDYFEKTLLHTQDYGENTIDYRKLKEEFDNISSSGQSSDENNDAQKTTNNLDKNEDEGSFRVIEVDSRGFDFAINIINLIYLKESKAIDYYKTISLELITNYKAYPVFYSYKTSDSKHIEAFDSFSHFSTSVVSTELKEWWLGLKTQDDILSYYFSKNMTTWLCREIDSKSGHDAEFWDDVELPKWAENELTDKKVEFIFPYYDGVDRMGVAVVFFPLGLNPKIEKGLNTTLELIRTILLEGLQRTTTNQTKEIIENKIPTEEKKVLSIFSGLFNRNKAG